MKHTNRQTQHHTLTDLYKALDRQHAATITCLKEEKNTAGKKTGHLVQDIRTLEIYEIRTTRDGHIVIEAMDRQSGETRTVRVDRILTYTLHRIGYTLTRPEPTTYERPAPAPTTDAQALFFYELARDQDDADYRPRRKLTQTDTDLVA
ncbi:WYL domain-containing protein [Streptomyces sp. WAC08241]|uniref:WYL domain-containing protein n=1 Tax=Streptomyces sp. WAC08241 TaxID=2487421 RepID=UPI000F7A76F5|nr:WYL domain-containing protein [Streptomyces sp. WAC08241]RSS43849.1 WYL domain-containing protein [Streptomyces sp. WAC08241]